MLLKTLTLGLLRGEHHDRNHGGVCLIPGVRHCQLELVLPRCQIGNYYLVGKVGFLPKKYKEKTKENKFY